MKSTTPLQTAGYCPWRHSPDIRINAGARLIACGKKHETITLANRRKGNHNLDKLLKPLAYIAAIIIFSAVFVRIISHSETLADYAAKHPETETAKAETSGTELQTKTSRDGTSETGKTGSESAAVNEISVSQEQWAEPQQTQNHKITQTESSGSVPQPDGGDNNHAESEDGKMTQHPDRVVYQDGFYYEPLSKEMIQRITGISYPVTEDAKDGTAVEAVNIVNSAADIQVSYDDLCYMSVLHYNFHGVERTGELICNKAIAQDLVEIFYELYQNEYQIEQIRLIDEYSGDDTLSMLDNNTSCFNYRVVDGTSNLSKHALGLAIDINPFFNPYVVFQPDGTTYISPTGSETYADRSRDFAYKIDENDLCYKLFREHGFVWGGNWNSCKDYQHFQKVPD